MQSNQTTIKTRKQSSHDFDNMPKRSKANKPQHTDKRKRWEATGQSGSFYADFIVVLTCTVCIAFALVLCSLNWLKGNDFSMSGKPSLSDCQVMLHQGKATRDCTTEERVSKANIDYQKAVKQWSLDKQ